MKKLLISLGILLVPLVVGAAYNDVSLGTSAIISINDSLGNAISLTVSGSADVVESLVVGSASFTANLQSGSTLKVASAGRNKLLTDAGGTNYTTTCDTSQSTMTLTATAEAAVTVTVSPNACSGATTSSSSSSNGPIVSSGGGGGGGYVAPVVTTTPAPTTTSATTVEQLQAMIASLTAQIAALSGGSIAGTGTGFTFTKSLTVGSQSNDVKNLQKVLNSDSDTKIASSGAGSPGNETSYFGALTRTAIKKFQVKYGLAQPGGIGYGVFGPKTKAKMAEVSKLKGL
ncbi:MAG: peptidoglycan-binding domain-containing protein [Candidatus Paceibacterota bacterium]|jgi:hypothetical protein